jgi:diguanylate cyclase (GGDEF)-like protein
MDLVYQQVSLVMDTTNFFIALYDEETQTVQFPLAVEGGIHVEDRPDFAPRRAGHGLTEHVIQTHAPLLLRRELPTDEIGIEVIGPQARSWLGVPLMIGNRVLGVITVQSYDREGAYDTGHLILLSTIAAQAAVAIENARLYAQARRAEELATLNRISTLVTSSLDPQHVLDTIAAATARVTTCQKAAIFTRDEHENTAHLMASHGLSERFLRQARDIPLTNGHAVTILQGTVLTIEDLSTHPLRDDLQALVLEEGILAFVDVPLRGRDRVLGSLTAYYSAPHKFSQDEIELLTTFANHAAVAIENARLYASTDERLRERVTELITLQQVSLRLAASLDLPTVLDTIAEAALRLVAASDIHVYFYEQDKDRLEFAAGLWDTGERNRQAAMPRKNGITALTAREGRPMVIEDAEQHPLYSTPEVRPRGMKAIASFPLKRADRVVGVFNVAFLRLHHFSDDELRVLGLLADQAAIVIENARLYEEARRLSITDGLTGLYNSRHFYAILRKEMARIDRYDRALSLVMMDIDNFKAYNDAYGHLAGDDLLQDLARFLQNQIRSTDLAFRYGGEEFALLLPETEKLAAAQLAERIRASLAAHEFTVKEASISGHVTMSMGVAMHPADAADARGFVRAADTALYAAKAAGKNRVRVYNFVWQDSE